MSDANATTSPNTNGAQPSGPTRNLADLRGVGKMTALQVQQDRGGHTVAAFFDANKASIAAVLPKHMTPERMMKIALRALRVTPKLMECRMDSLFGAIITCSQLGLEPNTPQGHAYLIPFNTRRKNQQGQWEDAGTEVQVIIGYKGLIDLARRSGQIVSISARARYSNDEWKIALGTDESIEHVPAEGERGEIKGFYAVAKLKDGGTQFEYMSVAEVERIRNASQGYRAALATAKQYKRDPTHPWIDHFEEMGRKTLIRRLAKYLPMSIELAYAVELDGAAEGGKPQNLSSILDGVEYSVQAEDAPDPDDGPQIAPDNGLAAKPEEPPASLDLIDAGRNRVSVTATARPKAAVQEAWLARVKAELDRMPSPEAVAEWFADNEPHFAAVAKFWPEVAEQAVKLKDECAEFLDFPGNRPSQQPPQGK